jgi:hypothetical protein
MTVSESAEWLGFYNAGIKVFEDNDLNKKQAATTTEGLIGMLTYNEKILNGKRFLSCCISVLDFLKLPIGTHTSLPVLFDVGDHDPDEMPTVQVAVPHP